MAIRLPRIGPRPCYVGTRELNPAPEYPDLGNLRVAPFKAPDVQILGPDAMDPSMTEYRLACGDRPWGLWHERDLLCYGWTSTQATSILSLSMMVPGAQEAYFYGFYTPPRHRGRGYYPLLLQHIAARLAHEGMQRAWIAVFADNPASWKGVLKAGFQKAATHVALGPRVSVTVHAGNGPQPTLRARRRGLHVEWGPPAAGGRRTGRLKLG